MPRKNIVVLLAWGSVFIAGLAAKGACAQPSHFPLERLETHFLESVLRGWRSFQTSFALDGAACVDCHPKHGKMSDWAPSYPKAMVFDGTPYRVKGLAEVVEEALAIHTDLPSQRRDELVADLVSFIAWWGSGELFEPGRHLQAPPARGLALLRQAERRGRNLFENVLGCSECHGAESAGESRLSAVAARFPRYVPESGNVLPLIGFLRHHLLERGGSPGDLRQLTDLAAYLAGQSQGRIYRPGTRIGDERGPK